MDSKTWVSLAILAGTVGYAASHARAELPPGSYDQLRIGAEEALILEVESVNTKDLRDYRMEVVLTARVLKVERSKAGLKKGGKVTIRYDRLDTTKGPPQPGPLPLPIPKK